MTPDHYEILGVAPGADGAVIRAAYRALMRTYHPDRNDDPQAHARVRDITAAFAVLGDPEKRAAYDAARFFGGESGAEQAWFAPDLRSPTRPPPMRRLGLASIAIAVVMALAFAVRPQWPAGPAPQRVRTVGTNPSRKPPPAHVEVAADSKPVTTEVAEVPHDPPPALQPAPLPPPPPVTVMTQQREAPAPPPPRHLTRAELPRVPAPAPVAATRDASTASGPPAEPGCNDGRCPNNRLAQVERIATGFLKQSLEHADWHKQQLLLSAGNRSATARMLCRSDECVTAAYLHQIRDITTIMQGRIPNP